MTGTPPNGPTAPNSPNAPSSPSFSSPLPQRVVVELAPTRWQLWGGRVAWVALGICILLLISQSVAMQQYFSASSDSIQERYHSGSRTAQNKIAIITISGVIMEGDGFVKKQIDAVREDENVRGVLVRIESPGGTVTGSDYIFHHLVRLREEKNIPLVVSMGSIAASGGYYIAMAVGDQENSIFAEPTTTTGSIGVVIPHYDISGLLERFDVRDNSIASHPRKLMLSMTRPMSEDHRALAEEYVQESFERFLEIIKMGRPKFRGQEGLEHEGRDLATGELFSARKAKNFGLIDSIGFEEDALARVAELAGVNLEDVRVVRYRRLGGLLENMLGFASAQSARPRDWTQLLEASTPRAYYLCTTLPTFLTARAQ